MSRPALQNEFDRIIGPEDGSAQPKEVQLALRFAGLVNGVVARRGDGVYQITVTAMQADQHGRPSGNAMQMDMVFSFDDVVWFAETPRPVAPPKIVAPAGAGGIHIPGRR